MDPGLRRVDGGNGLEQATFGLENLVQGSLCIKEVFRVPGSVKTALSIDKDNTRAFHRGQGHNTPINRPDIRKQSCPCHQRHKDLQNGRRPYAGTLNGNFSITEDGTEYLYSVKGRKAPRTCRSPTFMCRSRMQHFLPFTSGKLTPFTNQQ